MIMNQEAEVLEPAQDLDARIALDSSTCQKIKIGKFPILNSSKNETGKIINDKIDHSPKLELVLSEKYSREDGRVLM